MKYLLIILLLIFCNSLKGQSKERYFMISYLVVDNSGNWFASTYDTVSKVYPNRQSFANWILAKYHYRVITVLGVTEYSAIDRKEYYKMDTISREHEKHHP